MIRNRLNSLDPASARQALSTLVERTKGHCKAEIDTAAQLRLYYIKPSRRERVGRVKVACKTPRKEWRPVSHMAINRNWSDEQLEQFLHMTLSRVPILRGPVFR